MCVPIDLARDAIASSPLKLRRWRRIRSVALEQFASRGYALVSVDDIAVNAGVSRRTYFNYFATKAAVLFDPDPEEAHQLGELLRAQEQSVGIWSTLTSSLIEYFAREHTVVAARREILGSDPSLDSLHMLANAQFEKSILHWLDERGIDPLTAHVTAAIALAIVRECFRAWSADAGYQAFLRKLDEGFALAGGGLAMLSAS
jgi:AcrR family transcriptional regulator